jgi:hypothetical protein
MTMTHIKLNQTIAPTFKSGTANKYCVALAKTILHGSAKAVISLSIIPRPKGRGYIISNQLYK